MDQKRKNYDSMPAPTKKPHLNEDRVSKYETLEEVKEAIVDNRVESEDGENEDDQEIDKDEILREILEVNSLN